MVEHHEPQPQTLPLDGDFRNTRIMTHLKDSLLSQLTHLDPSLSSSVNTSHHSSYIQRRLQQLFHSFDTPTHPPYALMIRRAITELNDGSGSTEKEISEFVRREYEDLPWAHVKILGFHLKKLCQDGELACTEGGRYMLPVDGGEETQKQCKGSGKRKRGKRRRRYHGDGEREGTVESVEIETRNGLQEEEIRKQIDVSQLDSAGTGTEELNRVAEQESTQEKGEQQACECVDSVGRVEEQTQSEKGWLEVVGKLSQLTETEAPGPNELQELQIQKESSIFCAEGSPECIISTGPGIELSSPPTQLQLQISTDVDLDVVSKMTASLTCVDVHDDKLPQHYNQGNPNGDLDENPMSGCLEQKLPKRPRGRPRKSVANYEEESLVHIVHDKQGLVVDSMEKQRGPARGRGRPRKVNQDTEQCGEQLRQKDQAKRSGRGRGRGRGRGWGWGRPPKPNLKTNQ